MPEGRRESYHQRPITRAPLRRQHDLHHFIDDVKVGDRILSRRDASFVCTDKNYNELRCPSVGGILKTAKGSTSEYARSTPSIPDRDWRARLGLENNLDYSRSRLFARPTTSTCSRAPAQPQRDLH